MTVRLYILHLGKIDTCINLSKPLDDTVIMMGKIGISSELMEERINELLSSYSYTFHEKLVNPKIIGSNDNSSVWFKEGFPSRILQPGEHWKEGKIRLRVVAEFIPDEPETIPADRPIEPSLDAAKAHEFYCPASRICVTVTVNSGKAGEITTSSPRKVSNK